MDTSIILQAIYLVKNWMPHWFHTQYIPKEWRWPWRQPVIQNPINQASGYLVPSTNQSHHDLSDSCYSEFRKGCGFCLACGWSSGNNRRSITVYLPGEYACNWNIVIYHSRVKLRQSCCIASIASPMLQQCFVTNTPKLSSLKQHVFLYYRSMY